MASAKGGSGKTVLTATFGTFLVELGKKVLLIDTDAATNGLTLFYLKEVRLQGEYAISEGRKPTGIYELEVTNKEIVPLKSGVHIIPATYSFFNTEQISIDAYKSALSATLLNLKDSYDYIFLDAQAGSDIFAQVSMSKEISDEVIIVSEYDPLSAAGVERLKGLFHEDLNYVRTWYLLNKMLPEFVQSFSDFLEVAKYLSPIQWDSDVVRAYARRRLALDLENGNEYTLSIIQTIKSLLGDAISEELESWTKERAALIRQPIEDQYKDAERQLKMLIKEKYDFQRNLEKGHYLNMAIILSVIMSSVIVAKQYIYILSEISPLLFALIFASLFVFIVRFFGNFIFNLFKKESDTEFYFNESRIHRQQEILEEKLRKLDALRAGDLETLIKYKSVK